MFPYKNKQNSVIAASISCEINEEADYRTVSNSVETSSEDCCDFYDPEMERVKARLKEKCVNATGNDEDYKRILVVGKTVGDWITSLSSVPQSNMRVFLHQYAGYINA